MALIIQSGSTKKVYINNTTLEYNQPVYVRLEFTAYANGRDMEVAYTAYENKDAYRESKPLPVNIGGTKYVALNDGEIQSLDTAHSQLATMLINEGFNVNTQR